MRTHLLIPISWHCPAVLGGSNILLLILIIIITTFFFILVSKTPQICHATRRHKCFTISNKPRPSRRWWRTCRSCRASVPRPFVGQSPPWCSRHRSSLRQAAQPLPWNINSKKLLAKRRMSDFPNRLTKIQPNASWIDNSCLGMADKVWKNIFHALGLKDICLKVAQSQQQQKW